MAQFTGTRADADRIVRDYGNGLASDELMRAVLDSGVLDKPTVPSSAAKPTHDMPELDGCARAQRLVNQIRA